VRQRLVRLGDRRIHDLAVLTGAGGQFDDIAVGIAERLDECTLFNKFETWTLVVVFGAVHLLKEHCQITIGQLAFMLAVLGNVDDREFPSLGVFGNTNDMINISLEVSIDAGFNGIA
jgi:hypothetical protein